MTTELIYSLEFDHHDNPTHPENAKRLHLMMDALKQSPFYKKLTVSEPTLLPEDILYEVHSSEMINYLKEMSTIGDVWIDLDTYVCQNDYHTARLAAGGLLTLCTNILKNKTQNGYALIRPPGHHATRERSMGFCLFNNAALAAHAIAQQGKRVLIFDHDVHHGNGTQEIFYHRNDVLYQSLHLSPHYPGTGLITEIGTGDGTGYTINAPLNHGNGNTAVTQLLDEIFLPIAQQYKPDLIMVSVGYDSHHSDVLGGIQFTTNFFGEMIARYQSIQPKLACTLEGGYNHDIIGNCLVSQIGQLISQPVEYHDMVTEKPSIEPVIADLRNELSSYWKL
jgi:acetoin utilization deacetylase AcuC-like enzyme